MKKGLLLAVGSYVSWGFLSIFWKFLGDIDSYEVFAYRIVSTLITMGLYFVLFGRLGKLKGELTTLVHNKRELTSMILASFLISINWIVYIYAIAHGEATAASLGYYINPLFSVLLAVVFLKEKLNNFTKVSILLALSGVAILAIQGGKFPIIALILPLSFGTYGFIKKNVTLSSEVAMFVETLVVMPFILVFLMFFAKHSVVDYSLKQLILLAVSGIVTAIPLLLFAEALKCAPLNVVGFVQYLNPTIQLAIAIFIFHEPFKFENLYGFMAIWVAILVFIIGQLILLKRMKRYHA
ncbi:EamA family transporter RarD [Pseudolactococcus plantarum]|uniref:Chloramphenicol-sensitive protein RarD n=1 Tax=Pseudolactococcus plantarum TaxID=1365 RepID=A0A2A5RYL5_9LACT|nr:EamA family transporter RarD [Lactococcus plantarum]PCS06238.1 chloramphenicol-sensitive protein RarD [Lactococcus plantarum]HCN74764.1 EamA family transporter RarD [Lactococcus sp.]